MTTTQILIVALGAVGLFAVLGAFVIAFRRGTEAETGYQGEARRLSRRDRSALREPIAVGAAGPGPVTPIADIDEVDEEAEVEVGEPVAVGASVVQAVEVMRVEELSPEEAGVSRRQFLTRGLLTTWGAFLGLFGLTSLAFVWPRLSGGFGSDIDVGSVEELRSQIIQPDGSVIPAFIPEARAYIVPFSDSDLGGSQFDENVVSGELTALFQRCVHLGCRVPWCESSQGFECPCHGSKYNSVGEYEAGPAPRNLDRFEVLVEGNRLIVKTSRIIQTPRASASTVQYPQGPSCIALTTEEE